MLYIPNRCSTSCTAVSSYEADSFVQLTFEFDRFRGMNTKHTVANTINIKLYLALDEVADTPLFKRVTCSISL